MQRNPNLPSNVVSRAGGRRVATKGGKRKSNAAAVAAAAAAAREAKLEKANKKKKKNGIDVNDNDITPRTCAAILGIAFSIISALIFFSPSTEALSSPEDVASAFAASCIYIAELLTPTALLSVASGCIVIVGCVYSARIMLNRARTVAEQREKDSMEHAKMEDREKRRLGLQTRREAQEAERLERLERLEMLRASSNAHNTTQQLDNNSDDHAVTIETPWLQTQHLEFERALDNYKAAMYRNQSERWQAIASAVPGKSAKQCIAHFREIKQTILNQKTETEEQCDTATDICNGLEDGNATSWLGSGNGTYEQRAAYVPVASSDEEQDCSGSEDDEEEDEDEGEDSARLAVDVQSEPKIGSTKVCLEGMQLTNVGVARVESLSLQIACERCSKTTDVQLGGVYVSDSALTWHCDCGNSLRVQLTPAFLHANNEAVGYLECLHCSVQDVLVCALRAQCLSCGSGLDDAHQSEDGTGPCVLHGVTRGRRSESNCLSCHSKLAVGLRQFAVDIVGYDAQCGSSDGKTNKNQAMLAGNGKKKKKKNDKGGPSFKVGSALPNQGACKHFSKSFRYLRFPCCGKAYACPVCHAAEGTCDEATWATRMICGKCSLESAYANRACGGCGFHMGVSGAGSGGNAAHWNGGGGTRSGVLLDKKDSRKHKGESKGGVKKTNSKKKSRVGVAGKKARQAKAPQVGK